MAGEDPWEKAFGDYNQALVDLNGDGVPDAVVPITNQARRGVQRRAMSGLEPTPQQAAGIAADQTRLQANSAALGNVGMELTGLPQVLRAGSAAGEAYQDPTIANVTNAGVQGALAAFRPMAAAKLGLAGLGAAAATDSGLTDALISPASAGRDDRDKARLAREQANAAKETAKAEVERLRASVEADRARSSQREYDSAIDRAEMAKNAILADRPKRFRETNVGQLYEKLGVIAPGVIAAGMGGLTRAATGGGSVFKNYVAPVAVGGLTGGVAANYPLGHELMFAPAANPERQAYETYGRELPVGHPLKEEMQNYARGLPGLNRSRQAAAAEFYDPTKMMERTGFGVVEGLLGGLAGADAVKLAGNASGSFRNALFGNKGARTNEAGGAGPMPRPDAGSTSMPPETFRRYTDLPASVRSPVQEEYVASRVLNGAAPVPGRKAPAIHNALLDNGIQVPVTPARVNATNQAYDQFVAANGRPPTRSEFAQIFSKLTLSLAGGVAAGQQINALMPAQP